MDYADRQDLFDAYSAIDPVVVSMMHHFDLVQKIDDNGNFVNDPATWPTLYSDLAKKFDVKYTNPMVLTKTHLSSVSPTIH